MSAIGSAEQQAAGAVRVLPAEHLSIAEIADLCGGQIHVKELTRLSRIPPAPAPATTSGVR